MMYLKRLLIGPMRNFTYILADPLQRIGTVVDPGWPDECVDTILGTAERDGVTVKYVLLTHTHYDHAGGVKDIVEKTGAEIAVHAAEACSAALPGRPEIVVEDGDMLNMGGLRLRIIHTPGHSPGSICILAEGKLFTGDTLFVGGCGRADLPGSDPEALYSSLFDKILLLPGDTGILPGHDYGESPTSTIGRERVSNPYLACTSIDEFLALRMGGQKAKG